MGKYRHFGLLYNDLAESLEIPKACDQFDDLSKPGLLTRLQKVLSGQRVLADETEEKSEARNVLFELVLAARTGNSPCDFRSAYKPANR